MNNAYQFLWVEFHCSLLPPDMTAGLLKLSPSTSPKMQYVRNATSLHPTAFPTPTPPTNSQPKLWIFMNHYDCLISESFTQFPLNPSGWVNRDGLSCPQQLLDPVSVKAGSVSTSQPPMTERTQQKSVLRTLNFPSVVSYSPGLGSKGKQSRCLFSRANKQVL